MWNSWWTCECGILNHCPISFCYKLKNSNRRKGKIYCIYELKVFELPTSNFKYGKGVERHDNYLILFLQTSKGHLHFFLDKVHVEKYKWVEKETREWLEAAWKALRRNLQNVRAKKSMEEALEVLKGFENRKLSHTRSRNTV